MARKISFKEKACVECKELYKPTSSSQKVCTKCLIKTCEWCGEEYKVEKYSCLKTSRFCSQVCMKKWNGYSHRGKNSHLYKNGSKSEYVEVKCCYCNEPFEMIKRDAEKSTKHFCKSSCYGEFLSESIKGKNNNNYKSIEIMCGFCGKETKVPPSRLKRKNVFCSMGCKNNFHSQSMRGLNRKYENGYEEWRHQIMGRREYIEWRESVFSRDKFTCIVCHDSTGGNLNAHHLDGFNWCEDKRYAIDNGATLCKICHSDYHKHYGYGDNTRQQFEEWLENKKKQSDVS